MVDRDLPRGLNSTLLSTVARMLAAQDLVMRTRFSVGRGEDTRGCRSENHLAVTVPCFSSRCCSLESQFTPRFPSKISSPMCSSKPFRSRHVEEAKSAAPSFRTGVREVHQHIATFLTQRSRSPSFIFKACPVSGKAGTDHVLGQHIIVKLPGQGCRLFKAWF